MPLQATSGAASYDAFGGGVAAVPKYIEDYFSTYLVTGDGTAPAVNNGIDLSTKGGLVWIKKRSAAGSHSLFDTARGANLRLISNDTAAQDSVNLSFTTTGFSNYTLDSGVTYASWSWAKAPKFFDVVTYTGTGSATTIAHNLGSVPGCIIVKRTDSAGFDWAVYHTSTGNTQRLLLNTTDPAGTSSSFWNNTTPTSTVFTVGSNVNVNASGGSYVAYLFAHNAGGFGLTGTDNVISCGRLTANGSATTVDLGFEPQWILTKDLASGFNWNQYDNMSGFFVSGSNYLRANTSAAQGTDNTYYPYPTATGFGVTSGFTNDMIYIAIRRGPMKVPTSGTSVFSAQTGTYSTGDSLSVGFPADMYIDAWRTGTLYKANYSRLVNFANSNSSASQNYLKTNTTDAEVTTSQAPSLYDLWNTTAKVGSWNQGVSEVWWMFRRAPSFFDEVCYTGTGSTRTVTHNLGVAPELVIVKVRSSSGDNWFVLNTSGTAGLLRLNSSAEDSGGVETVFGNGSVYIAPTSTNFTVGGFGAVNQSGSTFVSYLFATCAGVSKVGSYTGTGTTKQVDCGFTGGARFVLIKRTDSTGDWYVWDSARGIVAGNDPYLLLNSTAAEVTSTDYIDTYSAGFEISSTAPAAINASGGTFIFLAIA